MSFSLAVYEALNDTGYRMQGKGNSNRELRKQIADFCLKFPATPGLETMPFEKGKETYYPVIFALSTGGFLGMSSSNRCLIGVNRAGVGVSSSRYSFADLLIGYSDFNPHTIENVLRRALQGDPMSFEEWSEQKGQAGTQIINYGDDNTIGGRDANRW